MSPRPFLCVSCAFVVLAAAVAAQRPAQLVLNGLDPVHLCEGRETPGDPGVAVDRFIYRYQFASEESRAKFLKDPERYEIQFGGGCGRMGPLSGKGDPRRWHVHDGRIYIFASDGCRDGFKKKPEVFFDPDDARPASDPQTRRRGEELLKRAAEAAGGLERLKKLRNLRFVSETTTKTEAGATRQDGSRLVVTTDGAVRGELWYGDWKYAYVRTKDDAFEALNSGEVATLHETAVREMRRKHLRHPLLLLAAFARGETDAVAKTGERKIGDRPVEEVAVVRGDAVTTLAIDPSTGRVLESRCRGRGPALWMGTTTFVFSDERDVGGVKVPFKEDLVFNDKPSESGSFRWKEVSVDADLPPVTFARPAPPR